MAPHRRMDGSRINQVCYMIRQVQDVGSPGASLPQAGYSWLSHWQAFRQTLPYLLTRKDSCLSLWLLFAGPASMNLRSGNIT